MVRRRFRSPRSVFAKPVRKILDQPFHSPTYLVHDIMALGGQVQDPRSSVGGIGHSLDPARLLHAIDNAGERNRLDLQALGIECLVVVRKFLETQQKPSLRGSEPKHTHSFIKGTA